MKKIKLCICCVGLFLFMSVSVYARAGGGGTGGSSSGGHSHRSSSTSDHSPFDAIINIAWISLFILGTGGGAYYYRYKIYKKKHTSKHLLDELDGKDCFWMEERIQQQVEEIYYQAQSAWTNKNVTILKPYLSEDLYEKWRMKIDWMDVRKERNILEKVKLLSSSIVSVYDSKLDEHDMLWVCVRGTMVDYIVNEEDQSIIEGDTKAHEFFEYWKFIRKDDSILLDEIRQKDEVDIDAFVNLSEELHEEDGNSLRNH